MQNTKLLVHEKFVRRRRGMEERRERIPRFRIRNEASGGTFKNLFFIKPKRINLFHPVSSSISTPSVLLHGLLLHREFLRCSVLNITFIISPSEATGAWRKVQGSNASAEQKIYNSNSRYSRNKKFTFIMQIDIKCCRKKSTFINFFFTQIVLGSVPRRFEGNLFAVEVCVGDWVGA